jgi:phosphoribosylformylglycinamidine cyclo-ligase
MGIGMVLALDASEGEKAIDILASYGDRATVIGRVTGEPGVHIH